MVERYRPGTDSLKTPAEAVDRIHELARTSTYAEIAAQLNAEGWRTAFGRSFTSQHVGYICRRDGLARGTGNMRLMPQGGSREDSLTEIAIRRGWRTAFGRSVTSQPMCVIDLRPQRSGTAH